MSRIHKAIIDTEHYCMKCQKNVETLKVIEIGEMGYGSGFDGESTKIQLCVDCYNKSIEKNPHLWDLEVITEDYCEEYKFENEIFEFVGAFSPESQELFYNRFASGWNRNPFMEPQDWIDYENDSLPENKCKEYGLYSVEERKMYASRFPTCAFVAERVYHDGSSGAWCPFGANGRSAKEADEYNVSVECRRCEYYKKRTDTEIKQIPDDEWEKYKITVLYNEKYKDN